MKKILLLILFVLGFLFGAVEPAHAVGVQATSCTSQGATFTMQVDSYQSGSMIRIIGVWTKASWEGAQQYAKEFYANQEIVSSLSPRLPANTWHRHPSYTNRYVPNQTIIQLRGNGGSMWMCYSNIYL